jgi:hypothetical protein
MKNTTEVAMEVVILSVLNIVVVYLAAFTYALSWSGVLTVMVFASVLTAPLSHYLLTEWLAKEARKEKIQTVVNDGVAVLLVALFTSLAVLLVLTRRFNLPMALGISLLSGLFSSLIRHLLS